MLCRTLAQLPKIVNVVTHIDDFQPGGMQFLKQKMLSILCPLTQCCSPVLESLWSRTMFSSCARCLKASHQQTSNTG